MNIAVDAMGGDNAPEQIVKGAVAAVKEFPDLQITLFGDKQKINEFLTNESNITVVHTEEVIEATDEPVKAVRRKKNASMVLMAEEVKAGRADACISAGNTGALMTAGLFIVGRIPGIDRPALSPTLPTLDGRGFLLLDVGANVDAKPEHLLQYAIMGSIYSQNVKGCTEPRVGLLNVGTEERKGNDLTKQTYDLLQDAPIHFVGNVEARDLLNGVADVVVCDGFAGNIALKAIEGTALTMFSMLKKELTSTLKSKLAAAVLKPQLYKIKKVMNYSEHGGAALFGLNAPVVKSHGSSNATAVAHAIKQTREMVEKGVIPMISETVKQYNQAHKGE